MTHFNGPDLLDGVPDIPRAELRRMLERSPSAPGARGAAAVKLLTTAAGGTLLDDLDVDAALTLDGDQVFINWHHLAGHSVHLLARIGVSHGRANHPDAGYALALAAGLATGRITDTGVRGIHHILSQLNTQAGEWPQ